jgi:hypothetical protein
MCHPTLSNKTVKTPERVHSKSFSTPDRLVPTFPAETAPQHLDVSELTSSDLALLRREDPFMYYSIPSVKIAALHCVDVHTPAGLALPPNPNGSEMESKNNSSTKRTVTRQRRISAECHPDILMEEMLADTNFMSSLEALESDMDDIDNLYDFLLTLDETSR